MISVSDSQFHIRKSNTKLENLKVILWCFKGNDYFEGQNTNRKGIQPNLVEKIFWYSIFNG